MQNQSSRRHKPRRSQTGHNTVAAERRWPSPPEPHPLQVAAPIVQLLLSPEKYSIFFRYSHASAAKINLRTLAISRRWPKCSQEMGRRCLLDNGTGGGVLHAIPPRRLEGRRLPTPGPQIRANIAAPAPLRGLRTCLPCPHHPCASRPASREPWPVPAHRPRPPASPSSTRPLNQLRNYEMRYYFASYFDGHLVSILSAKRRPSGASTPAAMTSAPALKVSGGMPWNSVLITAGGRGARLAILKR